MESRLPVLGSSNAEQDFNTVAFEKKLLQLKDSQESINSLSAWCLEHRQHHKKIVIAWLNVLKKVKVEQRLTLFYLANDVIQYSKRKNYDFVGSWGTTLQKATTLVREEKVKHKILRIFKIWEQRSVYSEDFLADLSGLLSASTIPQKPDANQEFQPNYLITRIRSCAKLEENTDLKLKLLKDGSPKITDIDSLMLSLKDRRHVEDVEREVEDGITLIEGYVNALKSEIKSRTHLISILTQADTFYHTERGEVKVVANAYKNFSTRVKNLKKKLDELIPTLNSPIPSPDVNAPSPEPDSDSELTNNDLQNSTNINNLYNVSNDSTVYPVTETYNAGYYNPLHDTQPSSDFDTNNFSSFMNSSNVPFNIQSLYTETRSDSYTSQPQPVPVPSLEPLNKVPYDAPYAPQSQAPLQPPPMPPFTTSGYMDNSTPYTDNSYTATDSYANNTNYTTTPTTYAVSSEIQTSYLPPADAYNPEEDIEPWEQEGTWDPPDMETPESPPVFEKEGFSDPIEYDDSKNEMRLGEKDVDHRVLVPPPMPPLLAGKDSYFGDHRLLRSNSKDVDHRNLISLTGSPGNDSNPSMLQPPPTPPELWTGTDQDYRHPIGQDQDYRISNEPHTPKSPSRSPLIAIKTNIVDFAQQLHLPPPPPPPPPANKSPIKSKIPFHDNVESIDMDLSDDESSQKIEDNGTMFISRTESNRIEENNRNIFINRLEENIMEENMFISRIDQNIMEENNGNIFMNRMEPNMLPPPPIPQELCGMRNEDTGKIENGPMMPPPMVPHEMPPIIQLEVPMPWEEGWTNGRPPPHHEMIRFPPPGFNKRPHDFRGGFRGRGHHDHGEMFRGRGRGRGFRGNRGMNNNWGPNRGFMRGNRGFRGQFRGGY